MTRPWILSLIDDDEPVRSGLSFALNTFGYRTATYLDADDFLARGRHGCGIVICDIRMPGTNGIDLTRLLRMGHGKTPIILMTGHVDAALLANAMNAGADAVIGKPFKLSDLLAEITRTAAVNDI